MFGSGTCGNGCIAEHRLRLGAKAAPWLEFGDVVTMEVDGLGRISNRVVEGPPLISLLE